MSIDGHNRLRRKRAELTEIFLHTIRQRRSGHWRSSLFDLYRPTGTGNTRQSRFVVCSIKPVCRRIVLVELDIVGGFVHQVRFGEFGIEVGYTLVRVYVGLERRWYLSSSKSIPVDTAEKGVLLQLFCISSCSKSMFWVSIQKLKIEGRVSKFVSSEGLE